MRCFPFVSRDYGKTPFLSLDYVKTPFSPHPEANENKAKDGIGDNAGPCEHLVYDLLQPDVVWRARTGKTALQVIALVRQDPNSTAAGVRLTASRADARKLLVPPGALGPHRLLNIVLFIRTLQFISPRRVACSISWRRDSIWRFGSAVPDPSLIVLAERGHAAAALAHLQRARVRAQLHLQRLAVGADLDRSVPVGDLDQQVVAGLRGRAALPGPDRESAVVRPQLVSTSSDSHPRTVAQKKEN